MDKNSQLLIPKNLIKDLWKEFNVTANELGHTVFVVNEQKKSGDFLLKYDKQKGDLEDTLQVMAKPTNICDVKIIAPMDYIMKSQVVSGELVTLYMGCEELNYRTELVSSTKPHERYLEYLKQNGSFFTSGTKLEISWNGIVALMACADSRKRSDYEKLMHHQTDETEFIKENLQMELDESHRYGDTRWLTPWVMKLLNPSLERSIDLDQGISELKKIGLLEEQNHKLLFSTPGESLVREFSRYQVSLDIQSVFYDKDKRLTGYASGFLATKDMLFWINSENDVYQIVSVDEDDALQILEHLFAPGEVPQQEETTQQNNETSQQQSEAAPPQKEISTTGWVCSNCGRENNSKNKFCVQCGKPK